MIPQGAAAAGTFSSKGLIAGAYADGSETHKTTEEVEVLMKQIESERAARRPRGARRAAVWVRPEEKMRAAEAEVRRDAAGGFVRARRRDARVGSGSDGSRGAATAPSATLAAARLRVVGRTRRPRRRGDASSRLDAVNPKPETALRVVATHTLETLTATLRAKPVPLDAEDRAASRAVKKPDAVALQVSVVFLSSDAKHET